MLRAQRETPDDSSRQERVGLGEPGGQVSERESQELEARQSECERASVLDSAADTVVRENPFEDVQVAHMSDMNGRFDQDERVLYKQLWDALAASNGDLRSTLKLMVASPRYQGN